MRTAEEIKEKIKTVQGNFAKKQNTYLFYGELAEYHASITITKLLDKLLEWIDEEDNDD